jgi:hypothetical protein
VPVAVCGLRTSIQFVDDIDDRIALHAICWRSCSQRSVAAPTRAANTALLTTSLHNCSLAEPQQANCRHVRIKCLIGFLSYSTAAMKLAYFFRDRSLARSNCAWSDYLTSITPMTVIQCVVRLTCCWILALFKDANPPLPARGQTCTDNSGVSVDWRRSSQNARLQSKHSQYMYRALS